MLRFLDTNILLRYFTNDDEMKAEQALNLLQRLERGGETVETSLMVIAETIFTLERFYKVSKPQTREMLQDLLSLPHLKLPGKSLCQAALDLHVTANVSFVDAYNAVYMRSRGLTEIYSWDTDFDGLLDLVRVEPNEGVSHH